MTTEGQGLTLETSVLGLVTVPNGAVRDRAGRPDTASRGHTTRARVLADYGGLDGVRDRAITMEQLAASAMSEPEVATWFRAWLGAVPAT